MFTLKLGCVDGIEYGIVKRKNGSDVCTAEWNAPSKRWRNIEFANPSDIKNNKTRQAATRVLQKVEGDRRGS